MAIPQVVWIVAVMNGILKNDGDNKSIKQFSIKQDKMLVIF